MTDEEVTAAALADPDACPMTPEQLRTARRVPRTKTVRRALRQEEFAQRYRHSARHPARLGTESL
jgi:putative transcriptional regulator